MEAKTSDQTFYAIASGIFDHLGGWKVVEQLEAEKFWLFVGGVEGRKMYGTPVLLIDKETKKVTSLKVPSKEFFDALEQIKAFGGDKNSG